jgi:hypothetical protein
MMNRTYTLLLFLSQILLSSSWAATSWYVDAVSGDDISNTGLSDTSAFATIQHAVNQSSAGDSIYISAGTYNEKVTISGSLNNLTLQGTDEDPANVIINAGGVGAWVNAGITATSVSNLVIQNLKVTNCFAGIRSDGTTNLIIERVTATGNKNGIELLNSSSDGDIAYCTISDNNSTGIIINSSDGFAIRYCNVENNGSHGVYCYNSGDTDIRSNAINYNSQWGMYLEGTSLNNRISRNSITGNSTGGAYGGIALLDTTTVDYIKVNNIFNNNANDIQNNTTTQADAKHNWWNGGTPATSGTGTVDVTQALASEFIAMGNGIWAWHGTLFYDSSYRSEVAQYCVDKDLKVIYINVGPYPHSSGTRHPLNPTDLHYSGVAQAITAIRQAKPDIMIEALTADYAWLIPGILPEGEAFIQKIMDYQQANVNNEDALFDRIHLDVEPDTLRRSYLEKKPHHLTEFDLWEWAPGEFGPEWHEGPSNHGERRAIVLSFLDMVDAFKDVVETHTPRLHQPELASDFGVNYDNALDTHAYETKSLPNAVNELPLSSEDSYVELDLDNDGTNETPGWWAMMNAVDYVTLMNYSDTSTGLASIIENEAAFLEQSHHPYFNVGYSFDYPIGNPVPDSGVPAAISFYDDPWHQYVIARRNLISFVENNTAWAGEAYHYFDNYVEYVDGNTARVNGDPFSLPNGAEPGSYFEDPFTFIETIAPQIEVTAEPSVTFTSPVDFEINVAPSENYESLFLQISGTGYPEQQSPVTLKWKTFELSAQLISPNQTVSFQFPVESGEDYTIRLFGGYIEGSAIIYTYNTSFIRRNLNTTHAYALNVELKAPYDTTAGNGAETNWAYDGKATIKLALDDIFYDGSYRVRLEDGTKTQLFTIDASHLSMKSLNIIDLETGVYDVYLEKNTGTWTQHASELDINILASDMEQNRLYAYTLSGGESPSDTIHLISDAEGDFTATPTPGFPDGAEDEWTRFGPHHIPDISFDTTAEHNASAGGTKSVKVVLDWSYATGTSDWGSGVRYGVGTDLQNATSNSEIHYQMKYNGVGDAQIRFLVKESGGEQWEADTGHSLTQSFQTFAYKLDTADFTRVSGSGNNLLDADDIEYIGFNFLRGTNTTGTPIFHIDEIAYVIRNAANGYLITDAENDFTHQQTPDGGSREWTRFGNHIPVIGFDGNVANNASANGALSVMVSLDWSLAPTDWGSGVRYGVDGLLLDASSNENIHYKMKYDGVGTASVKMVVVEDNGEEWHARNADTITTSYQTFSRSLAWADFEVGNSNGGNFTIEPDKIKFIGFNFIRGSNTTGLPMFHIDEITWGPTP